jgi:Glycosyl transferase family 2
MGDLIHPPGTVVIVTGELTRYAASMMAFPQIQLPFGTQWSWARGLNLAANLNRAIAQATGAWVWLMGDDHLFAPDLVMRLLECDLDMVAPVCLLRSPPYAPIIYRTESDDGSFELWPASELPTAGVHPVAACSMAGMLIRRQVFAEMRYPWFEVGQIQTDQLGEDLWFWHKARLAGLTPYVNCDLTIDHITPTAIRPVRLPEGGWGVQFDPTCQIPATTEAVCP